MNFTASNEYTFYIQLTYILIGFLAFKFESSGKYNLPYSKFSKNKGLPSKYGMFVIYFFPILAYLSQWNFQKNDHTFWEYSNMALFVIHFAKRCLEVLFLHKYSGRINYIAVILITIMYSNIGLLFANLHGSSENGSIDNNYVYIGIILFSVGQFFNFYHHKILADLRLQKDNSNSLEYKIPSKGLFSKVVCPHYFFELVSWLGIAVCSTYVDAYFVFYIMVCYLSGRSHRTREWYYENVPEYPKNRNRIIPYIW